MGMMFGTQDDLNCIVDIPLKGGNNEPLCLGHKVSMHFFIAGYSVDDQGYVLKVQGANTYYPMPTGDELAGFQANSMIPSPLPAYSVPVWDYLLGYSLWIIIGLFAAIGGIKYAVGKRRAAKLAPAHIA